MLGKRLIAPKNCSRGPNNSFAKGSREIALNLAAGARANESYEAPGAEYDEQHGLRWCDGPA
jgi:hypothetical protein